MKNLPVTKNLKPIELIFPQTKKVSSLEKIQMSFKLHVTNLTADVFLYLNGQKIDMYYSIPSGKYSFTVYPKNGKNIVEIFYLVNGCKSPSVINTFRSK